jgi:3-oxoacyl-[acyl-carrier-protein] synthase II
MACDTKEMASMQDEAPREAWITGVGIVSCLGEGTKAHWEALVAGRTNVDTQGFAPYVIHPCAPLDLGKQIPRKADQRQMEPWQRLGTYAAGLALADAGVMGNIDLLARTDMIVAAGGGERDIAVDATILTGLARTSDPGAHLNERLASDLRPTLFLAQLSNLLAGNISIVHGVSGSSRTFMGEESAGVDALRIALARIAAGQSDLALVGGSQNAERKDMLLTYEFERANLKHRHVPVWRRGPDGGFALGSMAAFLLLEARDHAQTRGARPYARLTTVLSDRARVAPGSRTAMLERMWQRLAPRLDRDHCAIITGATGVEPVTAEERAFLAGRSDVPLRATGTHVGHGIEAQCPMNVALAALALRHGRLYPPGDDPGIEVPMERDLEQVVVTSVGIVRGEGMALVETIA